MNKNEIRKIVKERITLMSEENKQEENIIVCRKLEEILEGKDFQTLVTYHSFDDEVDVSEVSNWCVERWKKVITIPQSLETFDVPSYGVIIIPGRAFTENGKRIGRWSGFYDALLTKNPSLWTIGVCFSTQIFADLPEDAWDKRVNMVVFAGNTLE